MEVNHSVHDLLEFIRGISYSASDDCVESCFDRRVSNPAVFWLFWIILRGFFRLHSNSLRLDSEFLESLRLISESLRSMRKSNQSKLDIDSESSKVQPEILRANLNAIDALLKALALLATGIRMPQDVRSQLYELLEIDSNRSRRVAAGED